MARRDDVDADIVEELEARAAAESPRAARRWYRRQALGFAIERARAARRELSANARFPPWNAWISGSDARVAVRQARRQPFASLTAIFALATTIGLSVGVFAFARGMILPDLPAPAGTEIYMVRVQRGAAGVERARASEAAAWMAGSSTIASIGAFEYVSPPLSVDREVGGPVDGARVTPGPFAHISPPPLMGRHLSEADALPGAEAVAVISERLWETRFGADPNVIGRTVRLGRDPHTVVGVLPAGWKFPATQDLWLPLPLRRMADDVLSARAAGATLGGFSRLMIWAIVDDGVRPEAVADELTALARDAPGVADEEATVLIGPYTDGFTGGSGRAVALLVLGLLLVFVVGVSLNVANLLLARCAARAGELSVRLALGASRARIAVQLFVEALLLGGIAALIGTLAARRGVDWLGARIGNELPFWMDLSIDPAVFLFAAAAAVTASGLAGVVPALRLTRRHAAAGLLQGGAAHTSAAMPGRLAGGLLIVQLSLSLGFLSLAGLLVEGLWDYTRAPAVADAHRILTGVLYRDPVLSGSTAEWGSDELHALRVEIEEALRAIPGAEGAAVSLSLPRAHDDFGVVEVEGATAPETIGVQSVLVGPEFFETFGIAPTRGRTFTAADARPASARVAVVSERFAAAAFGGRSPLGRRLRGLREGSEAGRWSEIVGVVPDLAMDPGDRSARGEVYGPLVGTNFLYASVRARADPLAVAPALQEAVAGVDPAIRLTDVQPLSEVGWEARVGLGAGGTALTTLGAMALLLSLAGIYALASLSVTGRTREIGIRMALGASRTSVLRAVLLRSLVQLGAGTLGGLLLALLFQRATTILPFAIPGRLSVAVPVLAGVILLAGLTAGWIPARRALAIDPVEALRRE